MPYEDTQVAVETSQGQIRALLSRYGADGFMFGEERGDGDDRVARIAFRAHGLQVQMRVVIAPPDPEAVAKKARRARTKTAEQILFEEREQEARRVWRVLHWTLKARMEAVAENVETFTQAFLPHLVDPDTGETVYDALERGGGLARLQIGAGS